MYIVQLKKYYNMPTFLFDNIIFGPVASRRMGVSLGINLLPTELKFCNFNCVYCECGFTPLANREIAKLLPPRHEVVKRLHAYLTSDAQKPDAITFAGNGEPTIHPEFVQIITDVIEVRDAYSPKSEIVVLTNATQMHKPAILEALARVDRCMFKLDSGINSTIDIINQPAVPADVEKYIRQISEFKAKKIIQTMCIEGEYNGTHFSNVSEQEMNALIDAYKKIMPHEVILYTIERDTPIDTLKKVPRDVIELFAKKIEDAGLNVSIS